MPSGSSDGRDLGRHAPRLARAADRHRPHPCRSFADGPDSAAFRGKRSEPTANASRGARLGRDAAGRHRIARPNASTESRRAGPRGRARTASRRLSPGAAQAARWRHLYCCRQSGWLLVCTGVGPRHTRGVAWRRVLLWLDPERPHHPTTDCVRCARGGSRAGTP